MGPKYKHSIMLEVQKALKVAQQARSKYLDPSPEVEIPLAEDVAARVESLVGTMLPKIINSGVKERIRELEQKFGKNDERIAFEIAKEVSESKFVKFKKTEKAIEAGIRVGVAYLTLGIVTAPLEGLTHVKIKSRADGGKYLAIYFSGPIRSAGGTAAAMTVLLADWLRQNFGLQKYDPTPEEVERYVIEVDDYDRIANLQYKPTPQQLRFMVPLIPIEITGEPTERRDVLSYKDLPRVETNRIRGGMALTLCEGIASKAPKLLKRIKKYGKDYKLEEWEWLKKVKKQKLGKEGTQKISPNSSYMEEIPAGRPIFSDPSAKGGFRLRYGRSRNTGLAGIGLNPATMVVLESFPAVGTQLRLERPGKAGVVAPVDSILGPVVLLKNGDVVKLNNEVEAGAVMNQIEEILFVGDMLIATGEFSDKGHVLVPAGYCEEWWALEYEKAAGEKIDPFKFKPTAREALEISRKHNIPLHPTYTYAWNDLTVEQVKALSKWLSTGEEVNQTLILDNAPEKRFLELLLVPHQFRNNKIILGQDYIVLRTLLAGDIQELKAQTALDLVNKTSQVEVRDFAPTTIGARMGRPEKAQHREMTGKPMVLFPVTDAGGRFRSVNAAAEKGKIVSELAVRVCKECGRRGFFLKCECGGKTRMKRLCRRCGRVVESSEHCGLPTITRTQTEVDIASLFKKACEKIGVEPELVKGVRGMSSEHKIPERLEKGVLRAKYNLLVNKDGSIRYDSTDAALSVSPDTEVLLVDDGSIFRCGIGAFVDELFENHSRDVITDGKIEVLRNSKFKCFSFNPETYEICPTQISAFIRHPYKGRLLKITTQKNRQIKVTPSHSLFTLLDAEPTPVVAETLNVGDFIICPKKINITPRHGTSINKINNKIDGNFSRLLGYLMSVGGINRKKLVTIHGKNPRVVNDVIKTVKEVFGAKPKVKFGRGCTKLELPPTIGSFLESYLGAPTPTNPKNKKFPLKLLNLSEENIAEFLSAYIVADGRVSTSEVCITSASKDIISGLCLLFLRLGVEPSVSFNDRISRICVTGEGLKLISDKIKLIAHPTIEAKTNQDFELNNKITGIKQIYQDCCDKIIKIYSISNELKIIKHISEVQLEPEIVLNQAAPNSTNALAKCSKSNSENRTYNNIRKVLHNSGVFIPTQKRLFDGLAKVCSVFNLKLPKQKLFLENSLGRDVTFEDCVFICKKTMKEVKNKIDAYKEGVKNIQQLMKFINSDLSVDRIKKIEFEEFDGFVYDIEVCPNGKHIENFLCGLNPIIAHNTHFKPREIGVPIGKLKELGYERDIRGKPLESDSQILELFPQDILISDHPQSPATDWLVRVAQFIDELLVKFYGLEPYYNIKTKGDLIGQLVIGLAPHTSAGIVGRVIGFTKARVGFAHPIWHAGKRRNVDGDEDSIMLLLDAFLNFSRQFLPATRGGRTMDAPLVLTTHIDPREVDSEVWAMDAADSYPLEFYQAAQNYQDPDSVKILRIKDYLKNPAGIKFTHPTSQIDAGPTTTSYTTLESMLEKVGVQLELGRKIRAVDVDREAEIIISSHFLKDIKGNIRTYCRQSFRCTTCNKKYRRIPLTGKCTCGGNLVLTVAQGSVEKYLEPSIRIAEKYNISDYMKQELRILRRRLKAMFGIEKEKQTALEGFFR